jgi:hypothetical protein
MAVAVHGEPHRRLDFTTLQRAVNTAVSRIAKSAVRFSLFKLIQVDVPEGPT